MQALYEGFIASGDYRGIYDMLVSIKSLKKWLQKIQVAPIIQRDGVITQCPLSKAIRTIIKILENLLLSAMKGAIISELA